ncbi:hypothetical protein [Metabacillus schmidteae]|uniref:hypothetical protein n=1 Tax=Metabacillus schmidteae TaxID=2730405 RepID=UPI00158D1895|nr:hypothetical protein [Metabacillus schmidteae]
MKISRRIGDQHVVDVSSALNNYINNESINEYSETTRETVDYIVKLYPNIKSIINKFETEKPDFSPDLCLRLHSYEEVKVNLFYIKGNASIQPKNIGALSFLKKYFLSEELQHYFNDYFKNEYYNFLKVVVNKREKKTTYDNIQGIKKKVKSYFPEFTKEIESNRQIFLFNLREYCFQLMKDEFNKGQTGIRNAFKVLLMSDSTNIITRYTKENKCLFVEEFKSDINFEKDIKIYKKGNYSIGIRCDKESLLLRFKFESSPVSSIKLATSYEQFPTEKNILQFNKSTLIKFEEIINKHNKTKSQNISNAVGKCNEAMVYYQILKTKPEINQIEPQEFQIILEKYAPVITHSDLLNLKDASEITIKKLFEYLRKKYSQYIIDGIQLVPNNYIKDRLDTSDLKLILIVDNKYIEESISLKALTRKTNKITAKNPGIGQILSEQYFDIGSLTKVVNEVREKFLHEVIDHTESLKEVSAVLGQRLSEANQGQLRKGVKALLGSSMIVITFYKQNDSVILEHGNVNSMITVFPKYPSPIQTTLRWNDNHEELSLRVKFSAGQAKGWSSLKLACEFKVNFVSE